MKTIALNEDCMIVMNRYPDKYFDLAIVDPPYGIGLLKNYAKAGNKILDTHLGSGSSRIAAHLMGFEFVGCELDKDYFEAQEKRFAKYEHVDILTSGIERMEEQPTELFT